MVLTGTVYVVIEAITAMVNLMLNVTYNFGVAAILAAIPIAITLILAKTLSIWPKNNRQLQPEVIKMDEVGES